MSIAHEFKVYGFRLLFIQISSPCPSPGCSLAPSFFVGERRFKLKFVWSATSPVFQPSSTNRPFTLFLSLNRIHPSSSSCSRCTPSLPWRCTTGWRCWHSTTAPPSFGTPSPPRKRHSGRSKIPLDRQVRCFVFLYGRQPDVKRGRKCKTRVPQYLVLFGEGRGGE